MSNYNNFFAFIVHFAIIIALKENNSGDDMITYLFFLTISYLISSIQFLQLSNCKIPHNIVGKIVISTIRFVKKIYPNFTIQSVFLAFDNLKSPFFTTLSWFFFYDKTATTLTAILTQTASYYSIYYGFIGQRIHFISFFFTGLVVNPITGISMLIAFIISKKKTGYKSLATLSAVIVAMVKTISSVIVLKNANYLEFLFFISFGLCIIYNNRKVLLYLFSKNLPKHQNIKQNNIISIPRELTKITWINNKINYINRQFHSNKKNDHQVVANKSQKQQNNQQVRKDDSHKGLKNNSSKYKKHIFKNFKKFLKNNPQDVEKNDKYYLQ